MAEIEVLVTEDTVIEISSSESQVVEVPTSQPGPQGPPGPIGPQGESNMAAILEHIASPTPHAAYDDIVELTLLFENGIV